MDLHICQVESEGEITARDNNGLPQSAGQKLLAEWAAHNLSSLPERSEVLEAQSGCLPDRDNGQDATESQTHSGSQGYTWQTLKRKMG